MAKSPYSRIDLNHGVYSADCDTDKSFSSRREKKASRSGAKNSTRLGVMMYDNLKLTNNEADSVKYDADDEHNGGSLSSRGHRRFFGLGPVPSKRSALELPYSYRWATYEGTETYETHQHRAATTTTGKSAEGAQGVTSVSSTANASLASAGPKTTGDERPIDPKEGRN